ncbi:hypothetical protein Q75_15650 [Bacillus coahuilensis p1.1.43]|uniref:HIRAN domain-containing protein n=1 Tax=Bacillus coahuilensis p1.1.43 TaxID=1150625 RepID=A0A147K4S7_9BACI|nr:hypothetical protein Q75_15650 [Bacillus coahuilensis p1.1.43]
MSTPYVHEFVRLSGVTFEGRQTNIASLTSSSSIYLKRQYSNSYDSKAIEVLDTHHRSLGWIPKDKNHRIAQLLDAGFTLPAKIHQTIGGNDLHYGIEILLSNDTMKYSQHKPIMSQNTSTFHMAAKNPSFNYSYNRYDSSDDYEDDYYDSGTYFYDEDERGNDYYDETEDYTDLYEYNQNH